MKQKPCSQAVIPYLSEADYFDVFTLGIAAGTRVSPGEILIALFTDMPVWADALMKLRNRLVRLVGLKGKRDGDFAKIVRRGEPHGGVSFPVNTDDEIMMLIHDSHLDFRLSLAIFPSDRTAGRTVEATTVVHYNNRLGRLYFFLVKPFHRIIVSATLKRCLRNCRKRIM